MPRSKSSIRNSSGFHRQATPTKMVYNITFKDGSKQQLQSEPFHAWCRSMHGGIDPIARNRFAQLSEYLGHKVADWSLDEAE